MPKLLTRLISTSLGIGYIPWVPATWASAITAIIAWSMGGPSLYWVIGLSVAGLLACKPSQTVFSSADPKPFVMDETCGMLISLIGLPLEMPYYVAAFILFRVLDILKPWPISRIQRSSHATSIMWDDLAAGLAANLILQIYIRTFQP